MLRGTPSQMRRASVLEKLVNYLADLLLYGRKKPEYFI